LWKVVVKARQRISAASYGPAVLAVLYKAFDAAWDEVTPTVSKRPDAITAARLKLANIVLGLAKRDSSDAELIKTKAVQMFRLNKPRAN
jgi:hypothetical protein